MMDMYLARLSDFIQRGFDYAVDKIENRQARVLAWCAQAM
jgi:hypothetical protein